MKKFLLLLFITVGLFVASDSLAAEIFFGMHSKDVGVNTKFETGVFLNTQKESVNAVEGQIIFPSDSLEFEGFYNGNSLITFWIQKPALISQGIVSFSGITPGGFIGEKGYLFSLILKAKQKGDVAISTANEKVLLNDGNGSEAKITEAPLSVSIVEKDSSQTFTPPDDVTPPEYFELQISKDPNIFSGKYFLVFATQDKGLGIDHYEVMESGQFGSFASLFSKNKWIIAESPYLLQDQSLESIVYVRAVDRAGSERIAKVGASHFIPWYKNYFIWSIIAIIGIIFTGYRLWKKKKNHF